MLNISLANAKRHQHLTIYPLVALESPDLPFALMVDALNVGSLRISEVGSGVVGELLAYNSGTLPILILDGEQLIGAKQNRTTNRSMLLPAGRETVIPVSCMEQGRWHDASRPFMPGKQCSPSKVRRRAREVEAIHADSSDGPPLEVLRMAQVGVWSTIQEQFSKTNTQSPTGALDQLYESRDLDLANWAPQFPTVDHQVGLLAFVGGRPIGLDVIGCRRLYGRLHDRLLKGYIMDALTTRPGKGEADPLTAQSYLDSVTVARRIPSRTIGLGSYSVVSGDIIGGELTHERSIAHLSAFPAIQTESSGPVADGITSAPIQPPSRRRRGRTD
ncbi:hypothetical protein BH23GEM6_BH23GEM6_20950 [soil metagenome]